MFDFGKLSPEQFEFLVEDLLKSKGFTITERPSRGPDQGKDIIAERIQSDDMGIVNHERYLVECKHNYVSKKSVREADLGNFRLKITQHKANRYLLATTTTLSGTVNNQLNTVSGDPADPVKCSSWRLSDIEEMLIDLPKIERKYFRPKGKKFEKRISELANYLKERHFEAHRGAVLFCPKHTAIFGNDGYGSDDEEQTKAQKRTRKEVVQMRIRLNKLGINEIGFGLSDDSYTWVLVVKSSDVHMLNDEIWNCYPEGGSNNEVQKQKAFNRIWTLHGKPFYEACNCPNMNPS